MSLFKKITNLFRKSSNEHVGAIKEKFGTEEGDVCNRDGCDGTLEFKREAPCSCHTSPPCSPCFDAVLSCSSCDWQQQD